MKNEELLNAQLWAERTYGTCSLHDIRRTRRAVHSAELMAQNVSASLPAQMHSRKEVKALYRLVDETDVTYASLMQPHWQQTREAMQAQSVVLLVQDTTELNTTKHPTMKGVGPVGNEQGRGILLQTMLAIVPGSRDVLGCVSQEPFLRIPAPKGEQRYQLRTREHRESDVWGRLVHQAGRFPESVQVVHVADRGADIFTFFQACQTTHTHFLVRAAQNRRMQSGEQEMGYVLEHVRSWPSQDCRPFEIPEGHGRKKRMTDLHIAFGPMTVQPPRYEPRSRDQAPLTLWGIRLWEEQAPEGEEPVEWILLTSVPTTSIEQAWERGEWYRCRWIVEDYHQCLKTGCHIEERQVQSADRLIRLLGFFSPLAVRLLQVRQLARQTPEVPVHEVIEPLLVTVLSARIGVSASEMTLGQFWNEVAKLGGYQARRCDGPPGWKTLWKGWLYVQTLLEGVSIASHLLL